LASLIYTLWQRFRQRSGRLCRWAINADIDEAVPAEVLSGPRCPLALARTAKLHRQAAFHHVQPIWRAR
jgi:hypothetical protein